MENENKKQNKKVAILYAPLGGGHFAVARSLEYNFKKLGIEVDLMCPVQSVGSSVGIKDPSKSYRFVTKYLWPLDLAIYYATHTTLGKYIYNTILNLSSEKIFVETFGDDKYDLIVNILPHYNYTLQKVKKDLKLKAKTICVVSDIVRYIGLWEQEGFDEYILPTIEILADIRVSSHKKLMGLPIQDVYFENHDAQIVNSVPEKKDSSSYNVQLKILITSGGDGMGNVIGMLNEIDKFSDPGSKIVTVACGKNEALKEAISALTLKNIEVKALGSVPNLKDVYMQHDVMIIKGGPSSIWELININKPFIIYDYIRSQEGKNPQFAERYGRAIAQKDLKRIGTMLGNANLKTINRLFPPKEVPDFFQEDWGFEIAKYIKEKYEV